MQETKETSLITKKDLRSVFWRSFTMQSSWSFDKMMAYGFMYSIEKPLRKIYPKDDDYFEALHRHTETFNITPHVSLPLSLTFLLQWNRNAPKQTILIRNPSIT